MRKRFYWNLRGQELALGEVPLVAAVVPLSNEPAPDGLRYGDPDRAYARALQMEEAGAGLVVLAPETWKAGQKPTPGEEQLHRVVPVLKRLRDQTSLPLVVRTSQTEVAQRAIDHGALAIHDPSGLTAALTAEGTLAKVIAETGAGLILSQMRGTPEAWTRQGPLANAAKATAADLRTVTARAIKAAVEKKHLLFDPGLGLGKRKEENAAILADLKEFLNLESPLLVFTDAVTLSGDATDVDAAIVASVLAGAYGVGAFDVPRALALVRSAEAIHAAQPAAAEPEPTGVTRRRVFAN
jgi:dihydropteroate synthase